MWNAFRFTRLSLQTRADVGFLHFLSNDASGMTDAICAVGRTCGVTQHPLRGGIVEEHLNRFATLKARHAGDIGRRTQNLWHRTRAHTLGR